MGKKITTSAKTATPAKAKPAAKPAAAKQPATNEQTVAKLSKAKPKISAKTVAAKAPSLTQEEIALRAYYLGEKRRHFGLPGDESHDWIEAERQLLAETKPMRKKAAAK